MYFKIFYNRHWILLICTFFLTISYIKGDNIQNANQSIHDKKILIVLTNHSDYPTRTDKTGLWLTELTHFYDIMDEAGYEMDFVSPKGGKVPLDERSLKPLYLDEKAREHLNDTTFMTRLETTLTPEEINPENYQIIYYTGGHGTMWDFRNNHSLQKISEKIYQQGGIISAVCHGVSGLLSLQDEDGSPLIKGVELTGFSNNEEVLSGMKSEVPFSLQDELTKKGAIYKKAFLPFTSYAITSDRIITGQNPQSSKEVAKALLKHLNQK
ncbi:type 1 glutamine amidotransferase domain-containing protein [Neisseriaceae bacterium PsAf]|nr:type 1 glutamine amidotransferase domain-containing protein [Neisseriaceae bacterium PsAf]